MKRLSYKLKVNLMENCRIHNRSPLSLLLIIHFISPSLAYEKVFVGLVLDMSSMEGKIIQSSLSTAISDFCRVNNGYRTRVSLSVRDSHGEPLRALAAAVDLLYNAKVEAIIGGQSLLEAKLLAEIGEKAKVPVISLHVPSSSSLNKYSYFIQATHDPLSESMGITAFIRRFDWRNVILIYEDDDDWKESMQLLVDHFQESDIHILHKGTFSVSSSEDYIMEKLQHFKTSGTMVFIVHMSERLLSDVFPCAGRLGMMEKGYAWILTVKTMNHLHYTDHSVKESMEGVVGFRSHVPMLKELHNFTSRWRRSLPHELGMVIKELNVFGVWARDIAWILARAAETRNSPGPPSYDLGSNFVDPAKARTPPTVPALLEAIMQSRFKGFSDFQFIDKKFMSDKFEIVNIIRTGERRIGFWSSGSFSKRRHLSSTNELEDIIWPGGSAAVPDGLYMKGPHKKKLRVLVPSSNRFPELVEAHKDPITNVISAKGFCIDVFETSLGPYNYEPEYELWTGGPHYDNLAYLIYSQKDKYDAAVGDITITENRSLYVDFTIPFSDIGVGAVAAEDKSMWIFMKPFTPDLWLTTAAFFVLTGIVVWLIERPDNAEFQGSWFQQIGTMLWFGFCTLVYAHREKLRHNLSRFVVIVWLFAVLILVSNYTATLTSVMTIQRIHFRSNQNYIGFLSGSSIAQLVLNISTYSKSKGKGLNTSDEYAKALLNGTVVYVIDELPYLKVLLGNNSRDFYMVKIEAISNGFGFMFQKGSPFTQNMSREIAKLRSSKKLRNMETKWFHKEHPLPIGDTYDPLAVHKFRGLFIITGAAFALALTILLCLRLQEVLKLKLRFLYIYLNHHLRFFGIQLTRAMHLRPPTIVHAPHGETENAVQMVHQS